MSSTLFMTCLQTNVMSGERAGLSNSGYPACSGIVCIGHGMLPKGIERGNIEHLCHPFEFMVPVACLVVPTWTCIE